MRILWLCNIIINSLAEDLDGSDSFRGSWIQGLFIKLIEVKELELIICAPDSLERMKQSEFGNITYCGFKKAIIDPTKYDISLENKFRKILSQYNPDLVHIFGSEYPHTLAMVRAFNKPDKTIINIQGLVSICAKHYTSGIPYKIQNRFTFRDFIRQDNIRQQKNKFAQRGKYEIEAIKKVTHVVGRTEWDKACVYQINPTATYHECNEILREEFYNKCWKLNDMERFSIFMSQADYPIKGLHFVLEALPGIIQTFPATKLYIAGGLQLIKESWLDEIRVSSYKKYLRKLIAQYELSSHIICTGNLDGKGMCKQFLNSHVFVSASTLENESNSLSEAKILGVPVVASYVGGVASRIEHGVDGFLFQHDAPYMLTYYISKIFSSDSLAKKLSSGARSHAMTINCPDTNVNKMLQIYREVLNS